MNVLEFDNILRAYKRGEQVLDGVSFAVERGEKLLGVEVPEVSEGVVEDPPPLGGDPETPFTQPPLEVADVACHGPDPF